MDVYNQLKEQIITTNNDAKSLISKLIDIDGIKTTSADKWQNTCAIIDKQIQEDIVRIAVVGAIKSGKSTVANSIIGGDHLKRGAGVVTSIVTRMRQGDQLKAKIFLKSWDSINRDIQQAMVLFPSSAFQPDGETFDIRNEKDRIGIKNELETLNASLCISSDTRNENTVLLNSYLSGYDKIEQILKEHSNIIEYTGNQFLEHGMFTGNDIYATYVDDIQIEINSDTFDSNIELADCQGSDSPNPLHLAQVQDYLLKTHLIIYVVSSRTGLRQADIKFLSMIRDMGILDNILFVLNVDINEHTSIDDLNRIIIKVIDDISLIKPDPKLFSFSALHHLFQIHNAQLSLKDKKMHEIWMQDESFISFSKNEYLKFSARFNSIITQRRYSLLLKNHLERLSILGNSLSNFASLNREILKDDAVSANLINQNVKIHQKKMKQTRKLIKNTFDGSVQKLKKELKSDIDSFFDDKYGDVLVGVISFINDYRFDYTKYHETFQEAGFSNALYLVFQEFKQSLNSHMTEKANPMIIKFVRELEQKISEFLESIAKPFDLIVKDAMEEYQVSMRKLGLTLEIKVLDYKTKDIDNIKNEANIELAKAVSITSYTNFIKTDAIIRFGFYSVINYIKGIFNKKNKKADASQALADGVKRIQNETVKSIKFHFLDYKENLKFKYIFAVIDAVVDDLYNSLNERFHNYVDDLTDVSMAINENTINKDQLIENLVNIQYDTDNIQGRVGQIRKKIEMTLN